MSNNIVRSIYFSNLIFNLSFNSQKDFSSYETLENDFDNTGVEFCSGQIRSLK